MDLLRFVRIALRSFGREPTFTLAFVLTLGLGIGANTAIFSLVYGVLLRPLPYPEAERIVYLENAAKGAGIENMNFSFDEVGDYREQVSSLEQIVEFGDWTFNVVGRGEPHRAIAGLVTANFFDVLGMRPLLGRVLQPQDRGKGAAPVAVLTYEYWQRALSGDPEIVGQKLDLAAKVATIVGVLEPGAHYATQRRQDFYTNYTTNDHYSSATMEDDRSHRMTDVFALLAPGATIEEAHTELNHVLTRFKEDYPDDYPDNLGFEVEVTAWKDELVARARPTLFLLLGAAGFVLVIACANVANLTLARTLRRERELALRSALGAGTARLRFQLFGESLVLALGGATFGLLLAFSLLDALRAYTSRFTNRTGEIAIDGGVLAFTLLVAVGTAVAFSLLPGLVPARRLGEALAAGSARSTATGARKVLQRTLVTGQLAVSFVLLVGAGLLVRTLSNLHAVDPGFELERVLSIETPSSGDFGSDVDQRFSRGAVVDIGKIASVESVALSQSAPLGDAERFPVQVQVEGVAADPQSSVPALWDAVSPGYFETLGVEVLEGRAFREADDRQSTAVGIFNESAARHYFGEGVGSDHAAGIGKRISYSFGGFGLSEVTLVGIVADSRITSVETTGEHFLYLPEAQSFPGQTVLVRTQGDPLIVAPQVLETLRALDPERPLEHIATLAELRSASLAPQRLNAILFLVFGALALAIAAVGVAAVLAFTVSARRRELGIRAALGATPSQLLGMVLRDGLVMAFVGLGLGALGSVALTRLMSGLLFEVAPLDAPTFVAVGLVLFLVALGAALIPALRATRMAPVEVLRAD